MMNINSLLQQVNYLKKSFNGDPNQYIQQMLNSGRITQEQYNRAVQQTNQLRKSLGI